MEGPSVRGEWALPNADRVPAASPTPHCHPNGRAEPHRPAYNVTRRRTKKRSRFVRSGQGVEAVARGRCQPGTRGDDSPHHRPCDHVVVSYDLAVWDGEHPLDDDAAGSAFDELYERYLESEDVAVPPSPRIDAYVNALIERYPEDGRDSPWASPPVIDEASGPIVYLLMSYGRAEEVSEYAAALAREYGLICFDPQGERLLVGNDGEALRGQMPTGSCRGGPASLSLTRPQLLPPQ